MKNSLTNGWRKSMDKKSFFTYIVQTFRKEIEQGKFLFNECVDGVKVDLFIPSKKMAFKLRGYCWDENGYQKPKNEVKHFLNLGIRLMNIYDYEWKMFQENFQTFIYHTIRSRNKHLIRSNRVVQISKEEFLTFLKSNHLFGDTIGGCRIMYGVYEKGELVAVAGFDKKSRKYDWEFKRFCVKYGWMTKPNFVKVFLNEFEKGHKGILVDYQQMDRFGYDNYPDGDLGFVKSHWNMGVVAINTDTMNYTRHSFIAEKPLTKQETMEKYGFNMEISNAGTTTWIKEIK